MKRTNPLQFELMPTSAPKQLISQHQIILAGRCIAYTVKRSLRRRGITLIVDEGGLRVGAPWRASQRRIEHVLEAHADWITRKLAEWQARQAPPFRWQAGAVVMLKGEPLKLAPAGERTATQHDHDHLYVTVDIDDPAMLAAHVISWLRGVAHDWFAQRAEFFAPALAVRMPLIRLSNARSRWGSCHPAGRVSLSWRLIQMPPPLIDYVVVHELAHLHEPNHSQRFWHRVAEVLPDHKTWRRTLRLQGHRYLVP